MTSTRGRLALHGAHTPSAQLPLWHCRQSASRHQRPEPRGARLPPGRPPNAPMHCDTAVLGALCNVRRIPRGRPPDREQPSGADALEVPWPLPCASGSLLYHEHARAPPASRRAQTVGAAAALALQARAARLARGERPAHDGASHAHGIEPAAEAHVELARGAPLGALLPERERPAGGGDAGAGGKTPLCTTSLRELSAPSPAQRMPMLRKPTLGPMFSS